MDLVKGSAEEAFDRSIDVHSSHLRQKLGDDPRSPRLLKTVRGVGYMLASICPARTPTGQSPRRPALVRVDPPEKPQHSVEEREGLRRAAGDVEVDRNLRRDAVGGMGGPAERTATERAGAEGDDDLRRRGRLVRLLQGEAPVGGDRSGDDPSGPGA